MKSGRKKYVKGCNMFNHSKLAAKIATGDFSVVLDGKKCRAVPNDSGTGMLGSIAWKVNSVRKKGYTLFSLTLTNTDNYYTTYNGVNGWMFTSKTDSEKWIFLPAAGYWSDDNISFTGSYGYYWSSVCIYGPDGKLLHFGPAGSGSGYSWDPWIEISGNARYVGKPVRPVIEW